MGFPSCNTAVISSIIAEGKYIYIYIKEKKGEKKEKKETGRGRDKKLCAVNPFVKSRRKQFCGTKLVWVFLEPPNFVCGNFIGFYMRKSACLKEGLILL